MAVANSPLSTIKSLATTARKTISPLLNRLGTSVAEALTRAAVAARRAFALPELTPAASDDDSGSGDDSNGGGDDRGPIALPKPPRVEVIRNSANNTSICRDMNPREYAEWCLGCVKDAEENERSAAVLSALLRMWAEAEKARAEDAEKTRDNVNDLKRELGEARHSNKRLQHRNANLVKRLAEAKAKLDAATEKEQPASDGPGDAEENTVRTCPTISPSWLSPSPVEDDAEEEDGFEF